MKIVHLICLIFFCPMIGFTQTHYFVDASNTTGPWDGDTWRTAWKDFSQFSIDQLENNLVINIAPGTYNFSNYNLTEHKAIIMIRNKQQIVIKKTYPHLPEEGTVTFNGNGGQYDHGIFLYPAFNCSAVVNNIIIEGITFSEFRRNPINISGTIYTPPHGSPCTLKVENVTIKNCILNSIAVGYPGHNCAAIYGTLTNTVTVENCTINYGQIVNAQTDGIYFDKSSITSLIHNYIYINNNYIPTGEPYHIDCIQFAPSCTTFTIERNTLIQATSSREDNTAIIIIGADGNIIIRNNNIISEKSNNLIDIHINPDIDLTWIYNNTLVGKHLTGQLVYIFGSSGILSAQKYRIKNNIFYKEQTTNSDIFNFDGPSYTDLNNDIISYNFYHITGSISPTFQIGGIDYPWDDSQWQVNPPNSYNEDPVFLVTNYDYKLDYSSPAKNRGLGLYLSNVTNDLYGNPRPYWNDDFDIGCFEIEDSQLKIGIISYNSIPEVTHTLKSFGTYWERNSLGNYLISNDINLQYWSNTTTDKILPPDELSLWKYPGVEYKWLDRGNNENIGAGLYMLMSHISQSPYDDTLFLDLRDAVSDYSLNLYIQLDLRTLNNPVLKYYNGSQFIETHSGDIIRIWDANKHDVTTTNGELEDYWEHAIAPVSKSSGSEFHPYLIWGPYPNENILNGNLQEFWVYRSSEHIPGNPPSAFPVYQIVSKNQLWYWDETVSIGNDANARDYKVSALVQFPSESTGEYFTNIPEYLLERPNKSVAYSDQNSLVFYLEQNYPNPFNPSTIISFFLPSPEFVKLKVFDVLGRQVITLIDEKFDRGFHKINFDGKTLSSGIYFYSLTSGTFNQVKKMQLIK